MAEPLGGKEQLEPPAEGPVVEPESEASGCEKAMRLGPRINRGGKQSREHSCVRACCLKKMHSNSPAVQCGLIFNRVVRPPHMFLRSPKDLVLQ